MRRGLVVVSEDFPQEQKCCYHHWIIESAEGPVSRGRCQFCGEEKEFKNYVQDCLRAGLEKSPEYFSEPRQDKAEPDILSQAERLLRTVAVSEER